MRHIAQSRLPDLAVLVALALGGCATAPPACVPPSTPATINLADQGYALAGRVVSLLAAGKISGHAAIALNVKLQTAQADIRIGKSVEAQALIAQVSAAIP